LRVPDSGEFVCGRTKAELYVVRCRRRAHQVDPPSRALEPAKRTADFEAMIGERSTSYRGFVDTFGSLL
jgi:hypothetical protein